ncbi:MAG: hypothetical protein KatS3mg058_0608 [Roseiflexus sp.]|nr:MAG: hypothetical protein KatS3mg058_0608 [Roseiflexus sp.]
MFSFFAHIPLRPALCTLLPLFLFTVRSLRLRAFV